MISQMPRRKSRFTKGEKRRPFRTVLALSQLAFAALLASTETVFAQSGNTLLCRDGFVQFTAIAGTSTSATAVMNPRVDMNVSGLVPTNRLGLKTSFEFDASAAMFDESWLSLDPLALMGLRAKRSGLPLKRLTFKGAASSATVELQTGTVIEAEVEELGLMSSTFDVKALVRVVRLRLSQHDRILIELPSDYSPAHGRKVSVTLLAVSADQLTYHHRVRMLPFFHELPFYGTR